MENKPLRQLHPHDRLLVLLKSNGPATTADLAAKLAITDEAARQQLLRLQDEALVESSAENRGRGRPSYRWKLTTAANRRFPDSHAELATQLIQAIRETFGEAALERLIQTREEQLLNSYKPELKNTAKLKERLERLISLRNAEGYMAECRPITGGYLVIENHCPICAACGACLKLCQSELDLFKKLLGPKVSVHRDEYMINGSRRCVYHVRPKDRTRHRKQSLS